MKIVFLDIDGVLNNTHCLNNKDSECVRQVNTLLQRSGAAVVLSSSWRIGRSHEECRTLLSDFGIRGPFAGRTPDHATLVARAEYKLYKATERGHEIQAWLDHWQEMSKEAVEATPPVTGIVILDDNNDMAHLDPYLVRTDFNVGFIEKDIERALRVLERRFPS